MKSNRSKVTAGLIVLIAVFVLLSIDQPLNPNIDSWQERPAVSDGDNGFVYLMGLDAGISESPLDRGYQLIQRYNQVREENTDPFAYVADQLLPMNSDQALPLPAARWLCSYRENGCFESLLLNANEFVSSVDTHGYLVERYQLFIGGPNYATTLGPFLDAPQPPLRYLFAGHQVLRAGVAWAAANNNVEQALKLLAAETRSIRQRLSDADTLIVKDSMAHLLEDNLRFLDFLVQRYPVEANAELILALSPLTSVERSLQLPLKRDFRIGRKTAEFLGKRPAAQSKWLSWVPGWMLRPLYKPNMTVNQLYEVHKLLAEQSELSASDRADSESVDKLAGVNYRNLIGSSFMTVTAESIQSYFQRLDQLEELVDAVRGKLEEHDEVKDV